MEKTLFLSDLDGTLLKSDGALGEYTENTLNRLIKGGGAFTVCSARSFPMACRLISGLDLVLPAVTMNGVFMTDKRTSKVVSMEPLSPAAARQTIDAFLSCERPPNVFCFSGRELCVQGAPLINPWDVDYYNARRDIYGSFSTDGRYSVDDSIVYISIGDRPEIVSKVYRALEGIDGISYVMYPDNYSDIYFLEVCSDRASKKGAVRKLRDMYGFERVVVFGDNDNDLGMFEAADLSVCVENGSPAAKKAADIIIGTNDDQSVAKYIAELCE